MFELIHVDGSSGHTSAADQALIRVAAAREKNKRKDSRRSRRDANRKARLEKEIEATLRLPPPPPHDLSLVRFAEEIDSQSQQLLVKVFALKARKQETSPIEQSVDFLHWDGACFQWMAEDPAFLHSLLTTSALMAQSDSLVSAQPVGLMWFHLQRTISLLNSRLSNKSAHFMDSTLNVILTLAVLASIIGHREALRAHLSGLRKVVDLRGGFSFLHKHAFLYHRINNIDLTWVLMSGEAPFFSPVLTSWDPLFSKHSVNVAAAPNLEYAQHVPDERLRDVFVDMKYATLMLNTSVEEGTRYSGRIFQPILTSIQSRLLHLCDELQDSFSECIRLAMLAFLSTVVNFPALRSHAPYLQKNLIHNWITTKEKRRSEDHFSLDLWIITIAALSASAPEQHLYEEFRRRILSMTWNEVEAHLSEVMWVPSIHGEQGKQAFTRLFHSP